MLQHLVVKSAINDAVPHPENVTFRQRLWRVKNIQQLDLSLSFKYFFKLLLNRIYLVAGSAGEAGQVKDRVTGSHNKFVRSERQTTAIATSHAKQSAHSQKIGDLLGYGHDFFKTSSSFFLFCFVQRNLSPCLFIPRFVGRLLCANKCSCWPVSPRE